MKLATDGMKHSSLRMFICTLVGLVLSSSPVCHLHNNFPPDHLVSCAGFVDGGGNLKNQELCRTYLLESVIPCSLPFTSMYHVCITVGKMSESPFPILRPGEALGPGIENKPSGLVYLIPAPSGVIIPVPEYPGVPYALVKDSIMTAAINPKDVLLVNYSKTGRISNRMCQPLDMYCE